MIIFHIANPEYIERDFPYMDDDEAIMASLTSNFKFSNCNALTSIVSCSLTSSLNSPRSLVTATLFDVVLYMVIP